MFSLQFYLSHHSGFYENYTVKSIETEED